MIIWRVNEDPGQLARSPGAACWDPGTGACLCRRLFQQEQGGDLRGEPERREPRLAALVFDSLVVFFKFLRHFEVQGRIPAILRSPKKQVPRTKKKNEVQLQVEVACK